MEVATGTIKRIVVYVIRVTSGMKYEGGGREHMR